MREFASILNPKEMEYGSGENGAGTLKRRYPFNGNTEIAVEYASCNLRGGGEEDEDVSEESLLKVQHKVIELAEKVAEVREKGPIASAQLLENLSKVQKEVIELAEKDVAGTSTRRWPVNSEAEIAAEGASCSLGREGGGRRGKDVSEESPSKAPVKEKDVAGTLKRRYPVNGDTEIAAGDASCGSCGLGGEGGQGGGGKEEDVSEESLSKVQKEVIVLAEKVAEYREKGPVAFAQLLEKSLTQMRSSIPSMDIQVNNKPTNAADVEDGLASSSREVQAKQTELSERSAFANESLPTTSLLERLASANETLPTILRDLNSCKDRLDKAITARRQTQAKNVLLHPAPVN